MTFSGMIDDVAIVAWEEADKKGWHDHERSAAELIALLHSECSEMLEAYRARGFAKWKRESDGKPEGIMAELADVVIRAMDCAETWYRAGDVDQTLATAIREKMEFNASRPYRHGGKLL